MPIDNIKRAGKSIARSFVGGQLRRVAGNIAGLIDPSRNRDSSDFGPNQLVNIPNVWK